MKKIILILSILSISAPLSAMQGAITHFPEGLCLAIRRKDHKALLQFLDNGGSVDATHTHYPQKPLCEGPLLSVAAYSEAIDLCTLLLERGATVYKTTKVHPCAYKLSPIESPDDDATRAAILRNTIFVPSGTVMSASQNRIKTFLLCLHRLREIDPSNELPNEVISLILSNLPDDMVNCMIRCALQGKAILPRFFDATAARLSAITIQELKEMAQYARKCWRESPFWGIDIERDHGKQIRETVVKRLRSGRLMANGVTQ